MINLKFTGLSELARELPTLPDSIQKPVILGLSQVAFDEAFKGAGRHNKTGALLQSLFNRQLAPATRQVAHDLDRAPQALWVNAGTKAHLIRPKGRKALRWASGGAFHFAKVVHHPGYRGDPYMFRAADEAVRQFASIVDAALKEIS